MQCQLFCNDQKLDIIEQLSGEIKIGRKPKDYDITHATIDGVSYIYINAYSVSSYHFTISCTENYIVFTDTSRNGTMLYYDDKLMPIKQSSVTIDNYKDMQFVAVVKAKDVEYKLIFKYSSLTQSKNKTQDMENTLAATNEPPYKPMDLEASTPKTKAKTERKDKKQEEYSTPKNAGKKTKKPAVVEEADDNEEIEPEEQEKVEKKAKKETKKKSESKKSKKSKKSAKKEESESESESEIVTSKAQKRGKKVEYSKPVENSESDEAAIFSDSGSDSGADEPLESDSSNESESSGSQYSLVEEDGEEKSASISLAEPENFEDAIDIEEFKKYHPRLLFPQPLERNNFSYKMFLKSFFVHDQGHFWCSALEDDDEELLRSFSTVDEDLNPSKIAALFTSKLRTTSRFLLAILCGIPIISDQMLKQDAARHAIKYALRIRNACNFLYEPSPSEVCNIAPEFDQLKSRYFEQYSLTYVCRRNARHRMVIPLSLVVTEEGVLGHACDSDDDIYSFVSFCYILVQLGCAVKVVSHDPAACKHERTMMSGKAGLRGDLEAAPEEGYEEFLKGLCQEPWTLLVKEKAQFESVEAKKMLKSGIICSIFLAEDVTAEFKF